MADLSREHNSSPMPGVRPNPDPALDIAHEHHHEHMHHAPSAEKGHTEHDHPAYTTGTTFNEPGVIPKPDPNDESYRNLDRDLEKEGGIEIGEKGSLSKGESPSERENAVEKPKFSLGAFYKKYRVFFHVFIGALFTG